MPLGPEFDLLKFIPKEEAPGAKIGRLLADATSKVVQGLADAEQQRQTRAGPGGTRGF